MASNKVRDALLALAVGDALGVPHEFRPRHELERTPVVGMDGWGTWNQEPGTWSDDSSLSFCLAEMLCRGYDLRDLADRFVAWMDKGYWTARGEAFDVGRTVAAAIERLRDHSLPPSQAGFHRERDNGNGSLMRILPAAFYLRGRPFDERTWIVAELSSLTHGHRRSQLACILYVELALRLLDGLSFKVAYRAVAADFAARYADESEIHHFDRILSGEIEKIEVNDVLSSGYVVDTMETILWCLLNTDSFAGALLAAVNLGGDTDTAASLTGGLAGLVYGSSAIPAEWLAVLARRADIEDLGNRLAQATGLA
jgi:ADP-ribosyl-[dinitrogen reductase] hydrolase